MNVSSARQFRCLYTRHKTQKRKVWSEGVITISSSFRVTLRGFDVDTAREKTEIDAGEVDIPQGSLIDTELELPLHLVQITEIWGGAAAAAAIAAVTVAAPPADAETRIATSQQVTNSSRVAVRTRLTTAFRPPRPLDPIPPRSPSLLQHDDAPLPHYNGARDETRTGEMAANTGRKRPAAPAADLWELVAASKDDGDSVTDESESGAELHDRSNSVWSAPSGKRIAVARDLRAPVEETSTRSDTHHQRALGGRASAYQSEPGLPTSRLHDVYITAEPSAQPPSSRGDHPRFTDQSSAHAPSSATANFHASGGLWTAHGTQQPGAAHVQRGWSAPQGYIDGDEKGPDIDGDEKGPDDDDELALPGLADYQVRPSVGGGAIVSTRSAGQSHVNADSRRSAPPPAPSIYPGSNERCAPEALSSDKVPVAVDDGEDDGDMSWLM